MIFSQLFFIVNASNLYQRVDARQVHEADAWQVQDQCVEGGGLQLQGGGWGGILLPHIGVTRVEVNVAGAGAARIKVILHLQLRDDLRSEERGRSRENNIIYK